MSRVEAFALVTARGGVPRRGVTRQTRVLVVGELGWPLLANGRPSNSLSRARTYRVPVVSERASASGSASDARDCGRDLHAGADGGPQRPPAAGRRDPARDLRADRAARRTVRLSRPGGRAPARGAAGGRRRPLGDHPQPAGHPQMAARRRDFPSCGCFLPNRPIRFWSSSWRAAPTSQASSCFRSMPRAIVPTCCSSRRSRPKRRTTSRGPNDSIGG